jgi:ribosomal-protein-alanine N-acetyltransferase
MQQVFKIRSFKPKDLSKVVAINQSCLPENYSNSFFMNLYEKFPKSFIVAEIGNEVIGYILCRIETSISGFKLAKKGHLISIAVLPNNRNKGIGKSLILAALNAVTNYNAESFYLEVRVTNKNAINLYMDVGLKIERTLRGYYSDGEDAYIMKMEIRK